MKKKCIGFVYLILLLAEWFFEMMFKIVGVVHSSVRELTMAVEKQYDNEPTGAKK